MTEITLEEMFQKCLDQGSRTFVLTRVGNHWQASVHTEGSAHRVDSGPDPMRALKNALGFRPPFLPPAPPTPSPSVLSDIEDLL